MSATTLLIIEDVDRMIARGEFDRPNAKRLELIRGELREMSPIGTEHLDMVTWLQDWSYDVINRDKIRILIQNPIEIPELGTMPHPDVIWTRGGRSARGRPRVADIVLLIEVADTSVAYDTGTKALIYAEAGVHDYWVVDIPDRKLHMFRDPSKSGFQSREVHTGDTLVTPLLVTEISVTVDELFAVLDLDKDDP